MSLDKRRHFRIKFPPQDRPRIYFSGFAFDVIDLSESGVKFKGPPGKFFSNGQAVEGTIELSGQPPIPYSGSVVRVLGDLVIFTFKRYIPREFLRIEADRLLKLYQTLG